MTTFDTSLLPPPEAEEGQYPYRRVWRTAVLESGTLILGTLFISFAVPVLGFELEPARFSLISALLALAPLALWFVFSWRGERRAPQPRKGLLATMIGGALVANAVAAPFVEVFIAPDTWLNSAPGLTRIFGYMMTVGLLYEFMKYLVLRYLAWPGRFERRIDGVAYSLAVSLGFATVLNLRFALLEGGGQPGAAAIRITSVVLVHQGIGLVMGHRLMNLKFGRLGMFSLAYGLLVASFLSGFYTAFRAGLTVGPFGIGATANTPLLGFGFAVAFSLTLFAVFAFLISTAEAREARAPGTPQALQQRRR